MKKIQVAVVLAAGPAALAIADDIVQVARIKGEWLRTMEGARCVQ